MFVITISVNAPEPISSILNIAPIPPATTLTVSVVSFNVPSFEITFVPGIPVTVDLIYQSSSSEAVPTICSPIWNVPWIESLFKINSVTVSAPIWYLLTFSIIAYAELVEPVIVLPTNCAVSPVSAIALKTFNVSYLPSDTLNNCSLG